METLSQLAGRLHPMVLHVPVGLLVGLVGIEVIQALRGRAVARELRGPVVWLAAVSACCAVGSGLLLAREGDPAAAVVRLHKWMGFAIAAGCVLAAIAQPRGGGGPVYRFAIIATFGALIAGGHLGATMTHGADFLVEPFRSARVVSEAAGGGSAGLPAVLNERCSACHNETKAKAGLSLADLDATLRGGDDGPVITPGDPATSELARRIELPIDDDDHMPPAGKPQLTAEEIALVLAWVGDPDLVVPEVVNSAPAVVERTMPAPADAAALGALAGALVHVEALGGDSTLVFVDVAAVAGQLDAFRLRTLLNPLREQVAELALGRTAVDDDLLALFGSMPNLRKVDLSGTNVTDEGLAALAEHGRLEEIVLTGTAVGDASIDLLGGLPSLVRVYAWDSALTPEGIEALRERRPDLVVDDGVTEVTAVLEEEPPPVLTKPTKLGASLEPINTVCPVTGGPVDPAFAIVHEGRVIGFCCENCPSVFWEDPAAHAVVER